MYQDYNDNRLQSPTKRRPLHWEDHDSTEPNLHLLGELQAGVGVGGERSMDDFERHFGVDFKTKKIKEWAKRGFTFDSQKYRVGNREFCVVLDSDAIPDGSYKLWVFCLFDIGGNEVFREDICDPEIISKQQKTLRISLTMEESRMPLVRALIWPMIEDGVFGARHEYEVELKVIDTVTTPIATKKELLPELAEEGMESGILNARGNASSNLAMKLPDQNAQHPSETIFVFIASYCDPELPRTLDDCIQNARHPKNLRFGICWQYDRHQPVDIQKFKNDARFQFVEYPIEQSQGGTWARSKAQQFWKGEPYTLQIDSHMKFERDWDVKLIQMMKKFPSDKPLITANSPLFWYGEAAS